MAEPKQQNSADDVDWKEYQIHEGKNQREPGGEGAGTDEGEESILYVSHNLFQSQEDDEAEIGFYEFYEYHVEDSSASPLTNTLRLRHHGETANSTGLGLWSGAERLASYLMQNPDLVRSKRVVEVGAGVGLVGLTAHHLGASHVTMTDGDSVVLRNLRFNVSNNVTKGLIDRGGVDCVQLIWGSQHADDFLSKLSSSEELKQEEKNRPIVQVVLASDCIYMVPSLVPFWETVSRLLSAPSSFDGCNGQHPQLDRTLFNGGGDGILIYVNVSASQAPLDMILQTARSFCFAYDEVAPQIYIFHMCSRL